jgi:DNA-binding GntR family transcriptional regulator
MAARAGTDRALKLVSPEDLGRLEGIARSAASRSAGSYETGLETLRTAILDGTLPPGSRLPQEDLAALLQTGRIPVRRSLRVLEFEGLVRSEPNRGYTVTDLEPDDIEQIYHLRIVLESHAVRLAIPRLTGDDLDELDRIQDALLVETDPAEALILRDRFRAYLYAVTNRPRLTGMILRLRQEVARAVIGRPRHHKPGDLAAFLTAVKAGDADAAVADLTAHYLQTAGLLRRYLRERTGGRSYAGWITPHPSVDDGAPD